MKTANTEAAKANLNLERQVEKLKLDLERAKILENELDSFRKNDS